MDKKNHDKENMSSGNGGAEQDESYDAKYEEAVIHLN